MEIEKHINKLVNPLKDEDELLESLKIKLTKKIEAKELLELEAVTILYIVFMTGIDVNDVIRSVSLTEKQTQTSFLAYLVESSVLRINVRFPKRKSKIPKITKSDISRMGYALVFCKIRTSGRVS